MLRTIPIEEAANVAVRGRVSEQRQPLPLFWSASGLEMNFRGTELALDVETDAQGNVILKRHLPRCVFCGSTEEVTLWMGKGICRTCAGQIRKEEA